MFKQAKDIIEKSNKIVIIQAENPDGDSLGSALALEEILGDLKKDISLYCPVEIPKYMHYIKGWDRVNSDFDTKADLAVIVDTMAEILLTKVVDSPGIRHFLETNEVLVIDHHKTESDLSFSHNLLVDDAVATAEIIYKLAKESDWNINQQAAENMLTSIMSDSLGFTTQTVTGRTFEIASELYKLGASCYEIENRRREYMKKSPEILAYKGQLIERIEYYLDGKMALIQIPWEEIQKYSDKYNPSMLVLDEMRFVEGVEVGIAIKTYPDGRLTGKIRSNSPVADKIAGFFGGGGHEYAAGFRIYESSENILPELIKAVDKALEK